MSWLSDLLGGGQDNYTSYLQQRDAQQRQDALDAQARNDAAAATTRTQNITKRGQAVDASKQSANDYLTSLGLDPNQFGGDINNEVNKALSYTADDDPNVGQYLNNLGQTIYDTRTQSARDKAGRDINLAFAPGFETSRIGDNVDSSLLDTIGNESRGKAEDYVTNLTKRGVLTDSGKAAAENDLNSQSSRVRTILNELGRTSVDAGRSQLTDVANRGRTDAASLTLGNTFDPSKYTSEADTDYNNFISNLGDSIRSKVPTTLYDTSNLANIGGGAQGAGNIRFDPKALAGTNVGQDDTTDPNDPNNQKRITF